MIRDENCILNMVESDNKVVRMSCDEELGGG
jgi:hypothetical protein